MKQAIRLVAADFDGTLLSPDGSVSAFNLEMIRKAQQAGIVFAAATGRFAENAAQMMLDAGITCPIISTNGACVHLSPFGEKPVFEQFMDPDTARAVHQRLEEKGIGYYIFGPGTVDTRYEDWQHHISEKNAEQFAKLRNHVRYSYGKEACEAALQRPIHKFFLFFPKAFKGIPAEMAAFRTIPGVEVTQSGANNIEIMSGLANKGIGLKMLCQALNIPLDQAMAIGDNHNDTAMLEIAGLGVAMGNAGEDIKRLADAVTDSNTRDGVGKAIQKFCGL